MHNLLHKNALVLVQNISTLNSLDQYAIRTYKLKLYRISHYLWLDIVFIQRVVCLARGQKTHNKLDKNPTTNHGRFFLSHVKTPFLSLHNFSVAFQIQKCLASFQQNCVIIHCDIIAVVYEKFIPWVISTRYKGKCYKQVYKKCHLFFLFMVVATAKSEDLKAAVVQNMKTLVSKSDYSIIQKLFSLQSLPVLGLAVSILLDLADTEKCRSLKVSAIKCLTELSQVDGKCEYISI